VKKDPNPIFSLEEEKEECMHSSFSLLRSKIEPGSLRAIAVLAVQGFPS
jgi:hypothetical protein